MVFRDDLNDSMTDAMGWDFFNKLSVKLRRLTIAVTLRAKPALGSTVYGRQ